MWRRIGSETIVLTPERLGNDVSKSDRVQEWSYTLIISYSGAVKQLILVSIRIFSILKIGVSPNGTPHLPNFEFHKKTPEINVSTIDLDALKI